MQKLPDGSGVAFASLPLPASHWLTRPGSNVPPIPFRMGALSLVNINIVHTDGTADEYFPLSRDEFADLLRKAARHAVRAATLNGSVEKWDPDAIIQNLVVGMLGYFTDSGLSDDAVQNPGAAGDRARSALAREFDDPNCLAADLNY